MEPLVGSGLDGLGWSFKQSFMRYVAGLIDGRITVDSGATIDGSWTLVFPSAAAVFARETGDGRLEFAGGVGFRGYFGMLALTLARPTLVLEAGRGTLIMTEGPSEQVLADVSYDYRPDAGRARWFVHTVALTASAAPLFGGAYQAGDPLDAMAVSLPLEAGR